ncbi:MAG: glycosyltransferase [Bdellovibrio sp.]|nr:MAG: glycosyltransferase [Bdellovibrio sp.]
MKVTFYHKYDSLAASYRYRFQQFFPYLEEDGIQIKTHSFFSNEDLKQIFSHKRKALSLIGNYIQRAQALYEDSSDLRVVYMDALPYIPYALEKALLKEPYVLDLDDAIFLKYQRYFFLKNKFPRLFKRAKRILAGSSFIYDEVKKYTDKVVYAPTVVDLDYYSSQKKEVGAPLTVGWMGSPSTSWFLKFLQPLFEEMSDFRFLIIGADNNLNLGNVKNLELRPWSEEREREDLLEFDIGIMPLENDLWSRGKCGFKLLQYMACGIPVIASPVGANLKIVEHGENGFLASSLEDWKKSFEYYKAYPEKILSMGKRGRKKVEEEFSLQVWAPRVKDFILS